MGAYQFFPVDRVVYDVAAPAAVAEEAVRRGARRPFVLTSHSLAGRGGLAAAIAAPFPEATIFGACMPHTPFPVVEGALAAARAADPDLIVAVGGGSVVDTAKMVAFGLAHGLSDAAALRAASRSTPGPPVPALPLIAVPTTLSGSEWTWVAGSTDPEAGRKRLYVAREITPALVVLDPDAALATPVDVWLSTGIKGIDHAVEALCSPDVIPWISATNLKALHLFGACLPRAHAAPGDRDARLQGLFAIWLTSTGMIRDLYGAGHALSFVLGARCGVPHGASSAVILPSVLRYNAPVIGEVAPAISAALGTPDVSAANAVAGLVRKLGLPSRLRDVGIARESLADLAAGAVGTHYLDTNPRPITGAGDILSILEDAW